MLQQFQICSNKLETPLLFQHACLGFLIGARYQGFGIKLHPLPYIVGYEDLSGYFTGAYATRTVFILN